MIKLVIIFFIFPLFAFSQIPTGYYDTAEGLSGGGLKLALHNIIEGHDSQDYSSLHDFFEETDKKTNGKVWDMYSDNPGATPPYEYSFISSHQCGSYSAEGDCYNREHSWPQSWFGGGSPMYSDLFHLYPTDGYVNGRRSNYPFGEVGSTTWVSLNGSKLGNSITPGYSGLVFEPIDEYKGDFARSYLYMTVRYLNEDSGWPGSDMTTGAQLKPWALELIRMWDFHDPVSQKEIDRNNAVYEIQGNRNPFIDRPEWVDSIYGVYVSLEKVVEKKPYCLYQKDGFITLQNKNNEALNIQVFSITGEFLENNKINEQETLKIETNNTGIFIIKIWNEKHLWTEKLFLLF